MSVALEYVAELRREAGVDGVAHSWSYGRSPMTLIEDLFDQGLEFESPLRGRVRWYLVEYHLTGKLPVPTGTGYWFERHMLALDSHVVQALPWAGATYRRYGGRLFILVEDLHLDWVLDQVEAVLGLAGVEWRRRVRRLGRRRVVVLGFSVDPATGSIGLPRGTRRRLRALEHAEAKGPLPPRLRQVLQGLRALERWVAWRAVERAWERRVRARQEVALARY